MPSISDWADCTVRGSSREVNTKTRGDQVLPWQQDGIMTNRLFEQLTITSDVHIFRAKGVWQETQIYVSVIQRLTILDMLGVANGC